MQIPFGVSMNLKEKAMLLNCKDWKAKVFYVLTN